MFSVNRNDQFLTKKGIFTFEGIQKAYQEKSPCVSEYICKLLILNPAPRQMFIEQARGTPTFSNFSFQIQEAVMEQRTLLANTNEAKTPSGKISPIYSVQYIWRAHQKVWNHLTSEVMYSLLPERMRIHEIIIDLWNKDSVYCRKQLLDILRYARLKYGAWKAFKRIFKEAEERMDWEVYAILNMRFNNNESSYYNDSFRYIWITPEDQAKKEDEMAKIREQETTQSELRSKIQEIEDLETRTTEQDEELQLLKNRSQVYKAELTEAYRNADLEPNVIDWNHLIKYELQERTQNNYGEYEAERYEVDPSKKTLNYLRRRARRTLRRISNDFPSAFPAIAAEMLMLADSNNSYSSNLAQDFIMSNEQRHLWLHQQGPLLKIVEQSNNETAVTWAYNLLKDQYRLEMKKVPSDWLYRVSQSKYTFTHKLALDYIKNVTGAEEGQYYEFGYHKTIIGFLGLDRIKHGHDEITFAISYLQSAGANPENTSWLIEEFPLADICRLLNSQNSKIRSLGMHLLEGNEGKSLYEEKFTRDFFTRLLKNNNTFKFASKQIRKRYTSLPPEWYSDLLLSEEYQVRNFANELLKDDTMVANDVDWSEFCKTLLSSVIAEDSVYESVWKRLVTYLPDGSKLIENRDKIPMEFLRWLFVHSSSVVRSFGLILISEEYCTLQDLGVDFLKVLSTKREYRVHLQQENAFQEFVGSYMNKEKLQYLRDEENGYSDEVGERIRTWLENEFTLEDLGLQWCFDRVQWWSTQYNFVRAIFTRDVNFEQLSTVLPPLSKDEFLSQSNIVNGARQVAWYIYDKCLDANSQKANLYKKLLMERNPRYRKNNGMEDFPENAENMLMPQESFDFTWFTRWAISKREPIRQYALEMARFEMSYWIEQGNIGFRELQTFFTGYHHVQDAIVGAIYNPLTPVNESRIDIGKDSFLPEDLYVYCFGLDERPRNFALQIILDFPQKYGQPQNLLSLSDAKSYKVRQVMIQVLWKLYKNPEITPAWKPFKYSVVPFSLSREKDPLRDNTIDPNKHNVQANKESHYLGLGSASQPEVGPLTEDGKFDLHEFLRRILYTLPRDPEQLTKEEQARKERAEKKFGKSSNKKMSLHSSWENKKILVQAIRDLAVNDKDFASFVLPVLEEFKSVRGKLLHNACLTALVQIKNTHQI